jgi:hypothetical protein
VRDLSGQSAGHRACWSACACVEEIISSLVEAEEQFLISDHYCWNLLVLRVVAW